MFKKIILLLGLIGSFGGVSKPVVILVHGSFAVQEDWARPFGDFYQELEAQANRQGRKLTSFAWSGVPTLRELFIASVRLVKLIQSYPVSEEIVLIGHSHGGNIINLATIYINKLDLYSCDEKKLEEILQNLDTQVPSNTYQTQQAQPRNNDITPAGRPGMSIKPTTRAVGKKFVFDEVYLIGTPVDTCRFKPNMAVVANLYNLYSEGDRIQTVAGTYAQTYPHDQYGICNLSVRIKNSAYFGSELPSHSTIHGTELARWILHIPDILDLYVQKNGSTGLLNNLDGQLYLDADKAPVYTRAQG